MPISNRAVTNKQPRVSGLSKNHIIGTKIIGTKNLCHLILIYLEIDMSQGDDVSTPIALAKGIKGCLAGWR